LILPKIILWTWGDKSLPSDGTHPVDTSFWKETIPKIKDDFPGFLFMAEVYWDKEWELQQEGFDYTYDKRLYDRLVEKQAQSSYLHLHADPSFMAKSVRFLENHDEPRAATVFPDDQHQAAAIVAFCAPGMHFFHEGQLEGFRSKVSMHVVRRRWETPNPTITSFYHHLLTNLLSLPVIRNGTFSLPPIAQAWENNPTHLNFIAYIYTLLPTYLLIVVNYGETQGQCYVKLGGVWDGEGSLRRDEEVVRLRDVMSGVTYERNVGELIGKGLYLDLPSWGYNVFYLEGVE